MRSDVVVMKDEIVFSMLLRGNPRPQEGSMCGYLYLSGSKHEKLLQI
jgi:hypothetical protein